MQPFSDNLSSMPAAFVALFALVSAPQKQAELDTLLATGLRDLDAYSMLADLTTNIGPRLSGSPNSERAIAWAERTMRAVGLQNVRRIPCMVPHWVRGDVERASILGGGKLEICALGGSVATPKRGIEAQVLEVRSLKEAEELGEKGRGKIVFFNRPFDPSALSGGAQYGGAVDQRTGGASAAAKSGAIAVLVRSMTAATDDEPHTGAMNYAEGVNKIPAAALGIQSANRLSRAIARGTTKVHLELNCETLPDVPSASVSGEIIGTDKPNEIIVLGGHLDSWDLGRGAHDDGAGVTQAIEAARLMIKLGMKPKRTIRIVAFQNEENGTRGAKSFAEWSGKQNEKQYAACESDAGGFMPRAFGVDPKKVERVRTWEPMLRNFGIERFNSGGGGADVGPLASLGATLFGLSPDGQRYFDYHHSRNDTIDKVHPRELEFGAAAMAALAWLISQEGLE
jgi:hypothetical protein